MDDLQLIFYLVVGGIALLSKIFSASKKKQEERDYGEQQEGYNETSQEEWDKLLSDFINENEAEKDSQLENGTRELEDHPVSERYVEEFGREEYRPYTEYEEEEHEPEPVPASPFADYREPERPAWTEKVETEQEEIMTELAVAPTPKKRKAGKGNRYRDLLRRKDTLREAVIASEILRPKHF
ncbi:hypothetical protein FUAX_11180 [Fulvitalea axinellae]|uniref:Uncharacterized protein n=1 Tax=Fulvitalea axinellae TaxID=1182444 RepID=A0AAU9CIH1_9BACT|nr:hypothetical protein FUAX_11180 [Fulvitalea axinellae]